MSDDDSEKEVYCGVAKLKKNQRLGTAEECAQKNQIRYYGLKKIDPDILNVKKEVDISKVREKLLAKVYGFAGKRKNLESKIKYEKDADKKEDLKNELIAVMKNLKEAATKLKEVEEKIKAKREKEEMKKEEKKKEEKKKEVKKEPTKKTTKEPLKKETKKETKKEDKSKTKPKTTKPKNK